MTLLSNRHPAPALLFEHDLFDRFPLCANAAHRVRIRLSQRPHQLTRNRPTAQSAGSWTRRTRTITQMIFTVNGSASPLTQGTRSREIDQIRVSLRRPNKRHGFILERAVLEALKQRYHFEAWRDEQFHVPSNVDHMVNNSIAKHETHWHRLSASSTCLGSLRSLKRTSGESASLRASPTPKRASSIRGARRVLIPTRSGK